MSLRSWLHGLTAPKNASDVPPKPLPAITRDSSAWAEMFGSASPVPQPTERTALQVSAIYACVNLIAGAISGLPLRIYARTLDGERDELPNDRLWWTFNEEMCPRWMAAAGWEFMVASNLIHGDGFAEILRNRAGDPVGLVPIHPLRVWVVPWPDGSRLVYVIEPDPTLPAGRGERRVLDQDDVLHVPGFGFDGCRGLSPLKYQLAMAGGVALATQEYSAQFFANSARPDFALVAPASNPLSLERIEQIRSQIDERHRGVGRSHKPMVLNGGVDIKTITLPLAEIQLLEVRQFQIEEIARVYGVPPFMIGHTEKTTSWGSGVETMGTNFVRYSLSRHLTKFQNEINRKFFRSASRVAEFDTFELERADMKSLFEAFRVGIGRAGEPGFMTTDEVRTRLNLRRMPGGDQLSKGTPNAPPAP